MKVISILLYTSLLVTTLFACGTSPNAGKISSDASVLLGGANETDTAKFKVKEKVLWHSSDDSLFLVEIKALTKTQAYINSDGAEFWVLLESLDKILSESNGLKAGDHARFEQSSETSFLVTILYVTKTHAYIQNDNVEFWVELKTLEKLSEI